MKQSAILYCLCSAAVLLGVAGCQTPPPEEPTPGSVVSRAKFPIKFDGELKDAAWSQTPGYELTLIPRNNLRPRETAFVANDHYETAVFKMLYDDEYLYIGCALEDKDIVNLYTDNQTMLFRGGDLFEFFISPVSTGGPTCYWEFYAAPNGLRSSYFYPSRGLFGIQTVLNEDEKNLVPGFAVKVHVNGTLNNHKDSDNSWTAEMRIPLKELEAKSGVKFAPGSKWRVQGGRYNYGMHQNLVQNSVYPPKSELSYHLVEYYSPVEFR